PGVETVDHHLPVHRARDLDTPIEQILRRRRNAPVGVRTDLTRSFQEVGQLACLDPLLSFRPRGEKLQPSWIELVVKFGDERQGLRGQDSRVRVAGLAQPFDTSRGHVRGIPDDPPTVKSRKTKARQLPGLRSSATYFGTSYNPVRSCRSRCTDRRCRSSAAP